MSPAVEASLPGLSREDLLRPVDVAAILRIEKSTAMMYMRRGVVPATKIGRHWHSPRPLLDQYLTQLFGLSPAANSLDFTREDLLVPDGVATVLHVERSTAMSYMRRGSVPARKIGRQWYSPRRLLDEYLAELFGMMSPLSD